MDGIAAINAEVGLPAQVVGAPPMFDVAYSRTVPHDYRAILALNLSLVWPVALPTAVLCETSPVPEAGHELRLR